MESQKASDARRKRRTLNQELDIRQIFREKSAQAKILGEGFSLLDQSDYHPKLAWCADDHELSGAFDHVNAAAAHFQLQTAAADLAFDIRDPAAHQTTVRRGFGCEYLGQPKLVIANLALETHGPEQTYLWLTAR